MVKAELVYRVTPFQLDSLLLGGLIALLYRGRHRNLLLTIGPWIAGIGFLLALAYVLPGAIAAHSPIEYVYPHWAQTWGLTCVNVITAGFILCCLRPMLPVSRVLSWAPLRWLGRISYGAYVFHDVLHFCYVRMAVQMHSTFVNAHRNIVIALIALTGTVVLASLSYRYFETPFLKLKDRFST